jgi:hypothetical protein
VTPEFVPESTDATRFRAHILTRLHQLVFQLQNAAAGVQSGMQLGGIARLGKIIICPGLQPMNHIAGRLLRGEQEHIDIGVVMPASHLTADRRSVQLRHHPVDQGEPRPA